jgi:hypothetical protein
MVAARAGNEIYVAIGLPTLDMIYTDFALCLITMLAAPRACGIGIANMRLSYVPVARNKIVEQAQGMRATHLLFLDHDMTFPAETLSRLLAWKRDIVCATYARRGSDSPSPPLGRRIGARRVEGLQEVDRVPTGCLLITMAVFDKLTRPYFRCLYDEATGSVTGDDFVFSDRSRAAGFKLYCDLDLSKEIGHVGQKTTFPAMNLAWSGEVDA